MKKYVYFFAEGKADGNKDMKDLLGGKGANLAEMTNAGLPVPPGFTISTEACTLYYKNNQSLPDEVWGQVWEALERLEKITGKKLGDKENPLLVSVRSGAPISMPGMMDTILNLGLNDETVEGLAKASNNPRFAYDSYRRFIQMFSDVVLQIPRRLFEEELEKIKEKEGVKTDPEVSVEGLKELIGKYKEIVKREWGKDFPQDTKEQLKMAILAVFRSWNNKRAIEYRKIYGIPDDLGTAVNVQMMVFGNFGEDSGTGVGFTRNPSTGEKEVFGEFLINAQGEDVVAGIRTPMHISELKNVLPEVYNQLMDIAQKLERHYRDMQDFEFTVERGKLYMLQTRTGKRTGMAALRIAVDMVEEGLIDEKEAVLRVEPSALEQVLHPMFDLEERKKHQPVAKGLPASPGAASGRAVFTAEDAVEWTKRGEKVILVRPETSPEDIAGMKAAQGILTSTGGMTSHAAVVGRQMGKPAVVGCGEIKVDEEGKKFEVKGKVVKEGDWVSIDGTTGEVFIAKLPTAPSEIIQVVMGKLPKEKSVLYPYFEKLLAWADKYRKLGVRTNADTPHDARLARLFGAEGIGLARTEHMFFAPERLPIMQSMILAQSEEERREALAKLLPMQREDFYGLLKEMEGLEVTIRLLDPPLHEFLPKREELLEDIHKKRRILEAMEFEAEHSQEAEKILEEIEAEIEKLERLLARVEELHEFNPMLGHRGCRLGITYNEITEMQARAIFEAAARLLREGVKVYPEVMVPLVGHVKEIEDQKRVIDRVAKEVMEEYRVEIHYKVGTMIEVPRAALTADQVASVAEFFSFGTNDLTQMTFALSRDDAGKFLNIYLDKGIWPKDPFRTLDRDGVGYLMKIAVEKGRAARPELKVGICGEHGGDPESIYFCHEIGLDYVSASPYRVPVARLAAARAALSEK